MEHIRLDSILVHRLAPRRTHLAGDTSRLKLAVLGRELVAVNISVFCNLVASIARSTCGQFRVCEYTTIITDI